MFLQENIQVFVYFILFVRSILAMNLKNGTSATVGILIANYTLSRRF